LFFESQKFSFLYFFDKSWCCKAQSHHIHIILLT
jgi:hypothetical protein